MNEAMETKLLELIEDAKNQKMPAVHVVLHMLLGVHTNGTQSAFAKWCCQFSPFQLAPLVPEMEVHEDFPEAIDLD